MKMLEGGNTSSQICVLVVVLVFFLCYTFNSVEMIPPYGEVPGSVCVKYRLIW